jgi:hypothetical protein
MLWMQLVESCECFPLLWSTERCKQKIKYIQETCKDENSLPLSLGKEETFRAILWEIALGCRLDSGERRQYPTRSIHEPLVIIGFNRSSKFLYQIERAVLFVKCRKISEIWFSHGRHCASLLPAMRCSLVRPITQVTTWAGLVSPVFIGITTTFQNFSVSLPDWFPDTSRLNLLHKRLCIETMT